MLSSSRHKRIETQKLMNKADRAEQDDISMRKKKSYESNYGDEQGAKMYRRLQREAALASGHARHKKSIAKRTKKSG
jgi:hypothetical protein